MHQEQIPVTVIGGYLGAGKTTLLNHILRHNAGSRFAVLVNDFGRINIDADLIGSQNGDTISLANGCICCSLAGGFAQTMYSIRGRITPPDRVIIEASGVSDPFKVAQFAHLPGFRLDSVVVVADAEAIQRRSTDKYIGGQVLQQLRCADLLLLNKTDLISSARLKEVRAWVQGVVPDLPILELVKGQLSAELLFCAPLLPGSTRPDAIAPFVEDLPGHHHDYDYSRWSYTADTPLSGANVRTVIAGLRPEILRGKGFLYLDEDLSVQFVFQLTGKRSSLIRGAEWGKRTPKTQFVLIGLPGSIDGAALDAALGKQ